MRTRTILAAPMLGCVMAANETCRCFPGDACWPTTSVWSAFNSSIGGALIETVPLGSPCHDPNYDAAACQSLKNEWTEPLIQYDVAHTLAYPTRKLTYTSSSSVMSPFWANQSCDPFQPASRPCLLGNYIAYAVNVSTPTQVSKTLAFAEKHNVRLVIRNTGHDYNGKSTGAGAIGLWMHHLNTIDLLQYNSSDYSGAAIKVGAGVEFEQVYEAARQHNIVVVGGQCPSVGLAGGYTQGGGHSTLSTRFGLGADQVLEWQVITASGKIVTATPCENSDLYWALSGGGGGTYGVVWSMTAKTYPESYTTAASLVVMRGAKVSDDAFYHAVEQYHATLPSIIDAGGMSIGTITNSLLAVSFVGFGLHETESRQLLSPIINNITDLGIASQYNIAEYASWNAAIGAISGPVSVGTEQYGGWLIPRSVVVRRNTDLTSALRNITSEGGIIVGFGMSANAPGNGSSSPNSVLPAWREALIDLVVATPWNNTAPWGEMKANQRKMTENFIPQLMSLAPGSGAYLNEADPYQPDWKRAFYGDNYPELDRIKRKYDPSSLFYAVGAVGSDKWNQRMDGRLCRV